MKRTIFALIMGLMSYIVASATAETDSITSYEVIQADSLVCHYNHYASGADSLVIVAIKEAFNNIEHLVIPDQIWGHEIQQVSNGAFKNHPNLKSVSMPSHLTSINASAFQNCPQLASVTWPHGSSLGYIGTSAFEDCVALATFPFPASLRGIDNRAFMNTALTELSLPSNLSFVGSECFSGCTGLTEIDLTNTRLSGISYAAFQGCTNVTSVTLPETTSYVGGNAFAGCDKIETVNVLAVSAPYCESTAFSSTVYANATVTYPSGSEASYTSPYQGWMNFASMHSTTHIVDLEGQVTATYYDLSGRRIVAPTPGQVVIEARGTSIRKVLARQASLR